MDFVNKVYFHVVILSYTSHILDKKKLELRTIGNAVEIKKVDMARL